MPKGTVVAPPKVSQKIIATFNWDKNKPFTQPD